MTKTIAALCVSTRSAYHAIQNVECYDIKRDVYTFRGGMPIVAHPPCRAWSAFCRHQAKSPLGEKEIAPYCVQLLKANGGVLEHPAHSLLYDELHLPKPTEGVRDGLWSMAVNQSWWGDRRTKKTWLLFCGVDKHVVTPPFQLHNHSNDRRTWQLMSKKQRAHTTPAMAEWLVNVARMSTIEVLSTN